jgi:hypothetical protein
MICIFFRHNASLADENSSRGPTVIGSGPPGSSIAGMRIGDDSAMPMQPGIPGPRIWEHAPI